MNYSYRVEQAIRAAGMLHRDQVRRGTVPYPYVTHLVSVAWLTASYTDDEDVLITALLHDSIEDTAYTLEELEEDFGAHVRALVAAVSHPAVEDLPSRERWRVRRERYAEQLREAPEGALIVAAADKIHNMRAAIEEYFGAPLRFLADFGGTLDERVLAYQSVGNILNSRLENGIVHEFNHVFEEYRAFVHETQKAADRQRTV